MKKIILLLLLALVCHLRADWWQFQGNGAHDGVSLDSVVVKVLLRQDSLGAIDPFSGLVTFGNRVFVPTRKGLYCFDVGNGESLWCQRGSYSGVPAIINGRVVAVQAETLRCFTLGGDLLWSLVFPRMPSHPTVANDIIYLTAGRRVYAIDSSGALRWVSAELRYGFTPNMTPCCYDTFVVVATKRGLLTIDPASVVYLLNGHTGTIINYRDYGYGFAENGCFSTPTLVDHHLYFTTYHTLAFPGYARSVDLPENTQRWEIRNVPTYYTSSAGFGGRVFFAGEGLRCYDSTGAQLWVAEIGRVSYSSPLISAGIIWVGNNAGGLVGVDLVSGRVRQRFQCGSAPLTSPATTTDGKLIIADTTGHVYCFGDVVAVEDGPSHRATLATSKLGDGVYDVSGRQVRSQLDLTDLPRGVYICVGSDGKTTKVVNLR